LKTIQKMDIDLSKAIKNNKIKCVLLQPVNNNSLKNFFFHYKLKIDEISKMNSYLLTVNLYNRY